MSVRKDGQGQEDESEVGKEVRLRWDGECEEKVGENVDKEWGGVTMSTAASKCVDEERWKNGKVEVGPEQEWKGSGVAEWKDKKQVPEKDQK